MKSIVNIQSKTDLFGNTETKQKAREVFGKFLYEGELSILFGDSGTGKSILANDIAFFVSGGGHEWEGIESPNIPSLYIDLEMSDKQFTNRYSTAEKHIPDTYRRAVIDTATLEDDEILPVVENLIIGMQAEKDPPKFIIIDNISNGFGSVLNATKMRKLVFEFKSIKEKYGLTILLIAHTKKRRQGTPITKDDLIGSSMIVNFVDSAFAIGQSQCGKKYKYVKQIKTREDDSLDDVMSVKVEGEPFLHYEYLSYDSEDGHLNGNLELDKVPLTPEQEATLTNMLMRYDHTYAEMGAIVGISMGEVFSFAIKHQLLYSQRYHRCDN